MECTYQEGVSLLRKWMYEETELHCWFWAPDNDVKKEAAHIWRLNGKCTIAEVSDKLVLDFSKGMPAAFETGITFEARLQSFDGFTFETPADSARWKDTDFSAYASWLTAELPGDVILILAERVDKPD